jgi:hypothetical protein
VTARTVHKNWLSKYRLTFPVAMDLEKNALLTVIRENKLNIEVTVLMLMHYSINAQPDMNIGF